MIQRIGQVVGNYRITEEINSGTFGAVYKAEHTILTNRTVAIKFLHANYLHSQQEQALFIQEAQFLEQLKHPFILPIHDVGIFHDGCPYIIMKFASQGSLCDRLNDKAHLLSEKEILAILTQIGEALQYIHQQKIVHRDLKPANILFDEQRNAILADFGIAYMMATLRTHMAGGPGTPAYMAPEQSQKQASFKSDQYALGCIAYELFTGQRPFTADNHIAMAYQHSQEKPTPPTVLKPKLSQQIEQAILKAIAKQTDDRYPDVSAFIQALSAPFLDSTVISPPISSPTITSTVTVPTIELVTWPTTLEPGMVLGGLFEILDLIEACNFNNTYRVRNKNVPSIKYLMNIVRIHQKSRSQSPENIIRKDIQSLGNYASIPQIIRVYKSQNVYTDGHLTFKCSFYVIRELFEGLNLVEIIEKRNGCTEKKR